MRISVCHPEIQHRARGLCRRCYAREYAQRPEVKAKRRKYYESRRAEITAQFRRYRNANRPRLADYDKYRKGRLGAGNCAICKEYVEALHKDHNHTTMQIRGGLCFRCNALLGMAKEDPERLKAAIEYLRYWNNL